MVPTSWLISNLVLLIHFCRDKVTGQRAGQENQIGAKNKACLEYVIRHRCIQKTKDKRRSRQIFAGKQTKQIPRHVRNWKCTIVKCQRKHWKLDISEKQLFAKVCIVWCRTIVFTSMQLTINESVSSIAQVRQSGERYAWNAYSPPQAAARPS